jgi:hypothetical protein
MTLDPGRDRDLAAAFARLEAGARPDYTDSLLAGIRHVRQRPAWVFREWWLPAALGPGRDRTPRLPWRLIVIVALIALALVVAAIESGAGRPRRLPAPFGPAGNGAIVFDSLGDIYAGDPTKGTSKLIVSGTGYDFRPGFSPDGSAVAFLRRVDAAHAGPTHIVVAQADGSQPRVITIAPLVGEPAWYAWAPDSRSIWVMMSGSINKTYQVFDTGRASPPKVVTPAVPVDPPIAFQPPTGERVVVRGHVGSEIGLYTMGFDGSRMTPVVQPYVSSNEQIDLVFSAWSPDGGRIAVQRVGADGSATHLYVMNADGSGGRQVDGAVGGASVRWAVWSPDGSRIAFQRASGVTDANGYPLYTWAVLTVADGTVVKTGSALAYDTFASWSPDGTELLVLNTTPGHPEVILDPGGGPARAVPWPAVGGDWDRVTP